MMPINLKHKYEVTYQFSTKERRTFTRERVGHLVLHQIFYWILLFIFFLRSGRLWSLDKSYIRKSRPMTRNKQVKREPKTEPKTILPHEHPLFSAPSIGANTYI